MRTVTVGRVYVAAMVCFACFGGWSAVVGSEEDPSGILLQAVPDKLVVLTFDDSCASHYDVVAPILKRLGFGGSFYICDFDSFKTRKDWYMTWAQMRALDAAGFEIGNHTKGHAGGSDINPYLAMENDLLANDVPKPVTIAWPMFQTNPQTFADLTRNGYIFGRGGHQRPYRPAQDHPFDVPSLGINSSSTVADFVGKVRQAVDGRIVVLTLHGVPDMEHPSVSVEPAVFELMMQYLKDNGYTVIAMRDLATYIDPAKAATLPPTVSNVKVESSRLASEAKPWVAKDITGFNIRGLPPAQRLSASISLTVPYATDISALKPEIKLSPGATIDPAAEVARDFTTPQEYTVTGTDGSRKIYTVVVRKAAASTGKEMLAFDVPGHASVIVDDTVAVYVADETDVTNLAPTFQLSPLAYAVPKSGTPRDLSTPQTYKVIAEDGSARIYTARVIRITKPNAFTWTGTGSEQWSDSLSWSNNLGNGSAPSSDGAPNYILRFEKPGGYAVENDMQEDFALNQLRFLNARVDLKGKSLQFVKTLDMPPSLVGRKDVNITAALSLSDDLTVDVAQSAMVKLSGVVAGAGGLVKNGDGRLWISNPDNSYSGGTIINSGRLTVMVADRGLGAGPVTLNEGGELHLERVNASNDLILNGGIIDGSNGFGNSWNGQIILNGDARISSYADFRFNDVRGGISGPGSFTQIGTMGGFNRKGGTITFSGVNTYTGPTAVTQESMLRIMKPSALYNADATQWTADKIKVMNASTLQLAVGGEDQFTAAQVDTLIAQLSRSVDNNGLMEGAILAIDTGKATSPVALHGNMHDSKGPGGGGYAIQKIGKGTLTLSGSNPRTGPTIIKEGTLSLATPRSLGASDVHIDKGAVLALDFTGTIQIGQLYLDGKLQPNGTHRAENAAGFIKGTGSLVCRREEAPLR